MRILAVDDSPDGLFALAETLRQNGFQVDTATNGEQALQAAASGVPDIILLDINMPGIDGYEVTRRLKRDPLLRFIPIVLLTANDQLEALVKGFEAGANDYIRRPFNAAELIARVNAAMRTRAVYQELQSSEREIRELRTRSGERHRFENIIGSSAAIREILSLLEKITETNAPVLICGESGTGKEVIAQAVHYSSLRKDKPLVIQNCAAFNESLLESELFGHVRGAFTGAVKDKQGLFQAADGGSFFLDELGEMSPALQVKLLRVLQDGTFVPVGDTKQRKVDVRIIAATNRHLDAMISEGTFREDLFYRLSVIVINIPPLRERREDIALLAESFLAGHAAKSGQPAKRLHPETLKLLAGFSWPGNVRQLQNEIERLVIMSGNQQEIGPDLLAPQIKNAATSAAVFAPVTGSLKDAAEALERNMIEATLLRCGGNKSEAARELGISRSNLIAKAQSYGL